MVSWWDKKHKEWMRKKTKDAQREARKIGDDLIREAKLLKATKRRDELRKGLQAIRESKRQERAEKYKKAREIAGKAGKIGGKALISVGGFLAESVGLKKQKSYSKKRKRRY